MKHVSWIPGTIGVATGWLALEISGWTAAIWVVIGVFLGGWVPLYLMPWLRSRA
jgi:hypothetical protein